MKRILLYFLFLPFMIQGQNTVILDPNFEQALIDLGIDKDVVDGLVPTASVSNISYLNISHKNIVDLTGIEAFTSLESLNCIHNDITNLPLSQNTNLSILNCFGNNISQLDLSNNTALTFLNCGYNSLTELNLSNNVNLEHLACETNYLSSLNLSANSNIHTLYCNNNQIAQLDLIGLNQLATLNCSYNILSELNVGFNPSLTSLNFAYNLLSEINVTQNGALNYFNCQANVLDELDLTFNPLLEQLNCADNNLKNLDVRTNTTLRGLNCKNNKLRCLNVKNGNNVNFIYFYASFNQDLSCVEVDDESYANANWLIHVDPITTFNHNCAGPCGTVSTNDLSNTFNVYPNPTNDLINIDLGDYNGVIAVNVYDISGRLIFTDNKRIISLNDLNKGAYLVQVNYENNFQVIQVIKE